MTTKSGTSKAKASKASVGRRGSGANTASRSRGSSATGGYSKQAQELFARGRSAFSFASDWAGAKARDLPRNVRSLNLPTQKEAYDFVEQRPLALGALGFGIGIAVAALLPRLPMPSAGGGRKRK